MVGLTASPWVIGPIWPPRVSSARALGSADASCAASARVEAGLCWPDSTSAGIVSPLSTKVKGQLNADKTIGYATVVFDKDDENISSEIDAVRVVGPSAPAT